jgi:hypothetical protein
MPASSVSRHGLLGLRHIPRVDKLPDLSIDLAPAGEVAHVRAPGDAHAAVAFREVPRLHLGERDARCVRRDEGGQHDVFAGRSAWAVAGDPAREDTPLVAPEPVLILVVARIEDLSQRALEHVGRVFAGCVRIGFVRVAGVHVGDFDLVLVRVVAIVLQRVARPVRQKKIEVHLPVARLRSGRWRRSPGLDR